MEYSVFNGGNMVAQAVICYIIAMIIMNGQETEKLRKEMEANKAQTKVQCQSERVEDCPKQETK
jgi:hypothetical protein